MDCVQIAAIQFEPEVGNVKRNLAALTDMVRQAADRNAQLIVLPEMATTGYCWSDRSQLTDMVETIPGPTTEQLHQIAADTNTHIVIGLAETDRSTDIYYNSAALIGPTGVLACYRKLQPFAAEPHWAKHGDTGLKVVATPIGNIGICICMDAMYPEIARALALQEADIICIPVNWFGEKTPSAFWRMRARENGVYVAVSNRHKSERSTEFAGGTCIIDADGNVLSSVNKRADGLAMATADISSVRKTRSQRLSLRRPDRYHQIMLDTYCWNPPDFFGMYDETSQPDAKPATICTVQAEPVLTYDQLIDNAARQLSTTADLIVISPISDRNKHLATTIPGPVTDKLTRLAEQKNSAIVTELIQSVGDDYYRAVVCIQPQAEPIIYHSIHLSEHDHWLTQGSTWQVFDLDWGRISLISDTDLLCPESVRCLALKGADVIVCPAALELPSDPSVFHPARIRAGENNVFLAFANVATSKHGYSGIFGPDVFENPRREQLLSTSPDSCSLKIDTPEPDMKTPVSKVRYKPLLSMRQTHYYSDLVTD